jgi:nicotinamidase-related amidase
MSQPRTLLEMAGADPSPVRLGEAALILIDCQNEYLDGKLALPGIDAAIVETARILEKARGRDTPIFHIVHRGSRGGVFDREGHGGQISAPLRPEPGEAVIEKTLPNAFARTSLQDRLLETGRQRLVIAGFMTHMCVSSTVRAALDLGYRSTVVAAATATRPLPVPGGGVIAADALQKAALAELADRFAIIVPDAAALPV